MMNKIALFVILTIAAPVFAADVDFVATPGNGAIILSYSVNNGTISAMALDIDSDVAFSAVTVDSYFDVFMDAAYMDPDNYVLGAGTPIASQDVAGEIALPQSSFCISMGNLEGVATANEIVLSGPTPTTMTIDINQLRGGIVNTDGEQMTTNLPITVKPIDPICKGDANNDGKISPADLATIVAFLSPAYAETDPPYQAFLDTLEGKENYDANNDGIISPADIAAIVAFLSPAYADTDPQYTYIGCMP